MHITFLYKDKKIAKTNNVTFVGSNFFKTLYDIKKIKHINITAMHLIIINSVPNILNTIPHITASNGIWTILKSLYGTNPSATFLEKLKFHISSRLEIGFVKIAETATIAITANTNISLKSFIFLDSSFIFTSYFSSYSIPRCS